MTTSPYLTSTPSADAFEHDGLPFWYSYACTGWFVGADHQYYCSSDDELDGEYDWLVLAGPQPA